jgi:hypothetical protein
LPLLVATLALVCFQLTGPLHYALVEHGVCVEHGEAVHVQTPHADGHGGADHAHAAAAELEGDAVRGGDDGAHGAHEHCALAGRERDPLALTSAAIDVGPAFAVLVPSAASTSIHVVVRALDAAPKTSPPRLG